MYETVAELPMNYIAKTKYLTVILVAACSAPATESLVASDSLAYAVDYSIVPHPSAGTIDVTMQVTQSRDLLRELRFSTDSRISNFRNDGGSLSRDAEITWRPDRTGGSLSWTVEIAHERNGNGYDAWLDENWGLLRAEDIVPRGSSITLRGAYSKTSLHFTLPTDWSIVTAYAEENGRYIVDKAHRRFDQPDGWMVMGQLGVRRETIAGMRVAVVGPVGESVRRMDMLALLNWNLPELAQILPDLPPRLTIVSAGNPMWRGGLSAPQSLYIHAERPLISENSTSTLLHEVLHSSLRISANAGYDWIVEGLAEYYSLELLRRSGSISPARYARAMDDQQEWSRTVEELCGQVSNGATTALAVSIFTALNDEISRATEGSTSLDDMLPILQKHKQAVDLTLLQQIAEQLAGKKSDVLNITNLPGCRNIATGNQETN